MDNIPNSDNSYSMTKGDLQKLITEARKKFHIPAIAVTLMNSKSVYLYEIQGTRVAGTENPVADTDYFHIGSCSKLVLAVIAGKMVTIGQIQWDTQFFDFFPELKSQANPEYYRIALEDLFQCRAGIKAYTSGDEEFPPVSQAIENQRREFIKYLIQQTPATKQQKNGKFDHLYSNASYVMATAMLERVSGKTYEALVQQYLVDELKLKVYIGWPNHYNRQQPWGHIITHKTLEKFPPEHHYRIPYLLIPAGDLSMPSSDYARFIQLNLQGLTGKDNFIPANLYQYIHFSHPGFALGAVNGVFGGKTFSGMDGTGGTFFCRAIIIPEFDFAFTIMMNAGSATGQMKAVEWLTMNIVKKHFNWWWKFWL